MLQVFAPLTRPDGLRQSVESAIEMDNGADAFAFVHQVEGSVDLVQPHGVGNETVQRNVALLRVLDIAG